MDGPEAVKLVFELKDSAYTCKLWPYPFLARLRMELGLSCRLELKVDCAEPCTGALHSYFKKGDIGRIRIQGLGRAYKDALQQIAASEGRPELKLEGPLDRVYTCPEDLAHLVDPALGWQIRIQHRHHADVVVWNPWECGARSLPDMADEQYRRFICIETATVNRPLSNRLGLTLTL